jgi:hypothetical protein
LAFGPLFLTVPSRFSIPEVSTAGSDAKCLVFFF